MEFRFSLKKGILIGCAGLSIMFLGSTAKHWQTTIAGAMIAGVGLGTVGVRAYDSIKAKVAERRKQRLEEYNFMHSKH